MPPLHTVQWTNYKPRFKSELVTFREVYIDCRETNLSTYFFVNKELCVVCIYLSNVHSIRILALFLHFLCCLTVWKFHCDSRKVTGNQSMWSHTCKNRIKNNSVSQMELSRYC